MTPTLWAAVIQYAVTFGIDAAISIVKAINSNATITDAISALEVAKTKTAQDYVDEANKT
jgi:hypothetical protein